MMHCQNAGDISRSDVVIFPSTPSRSGNIPALRSMQREITCNTVAPWYQSQPGSIINCHRQKKYVEGRSQLS